MEGLPGPRTTAASASPRLPAWLLLAALSALILVVYRPALDAWFSADDFLWLEIGSARDVARSFVGPWGHGGVYRPLSRVSFYVDDVLFGLDARPWHLESLLWHAAGATLLALLLDRLSGERVLAVLAAVIFALLPQQYENTIWISARSHLISFTCSIAALLALDRFVHEPRGGPLAACALLLALALLTYEAAVYTPALALLVVLAHGRTVRWPRALLGIATVVGVTALYLVLRRYALAGQSLYATRRASDYLTPAFASQLALAGRSLVGQVRPSPWWYLAAVLASAAAAPRLLVIALFGLAVILIGYAPFAVVDGFGPRFLYAANAGLAILLAALLAGCWHLSRLGKPLAALLLTMLLAFAIRDTRRIAIEFREAGVLGRTALARLVEAWPDPDPDRPAVVLGAPTGLGHAMIFFTYFDLALGTFHPRYAGLRVPGHVLTDFTPELSRAILSDAWQREQARRARHGMPPLVCAAGNPDQAPDVDGFLRALLACDAVFYAFDRSFAVHELPRRTVEARLARGWRTP